MADSKQRRERLSVEGTAQHRELAAALTQQAVAAAGPHALAAPFKAVPHPAATKSKEKNAPKPPPASKGGSVSSNINAFAGLSLND